MTYRDDLERAHQRIEQLEEELEEERHKNGIIQLVKWNATGRGE